MISLQRLNIKRMRRSSCRYYRSGLRSSDFPYTQKRLDWLSLVESHGLRERGAEINQTPLTFLDWPIIVGQLLKESLRWRWKQWARGSKGALNEWWTDAEKFGIGHSTNNTASCEWSYMVIMLTTGDGPIFDLFRNSTDEYSRSGRNGWEEEEVVRLIGKSSRKYWSDSHCQSPE